MNKQEFEDLLDRVAGLGADDPVHAHGILSRTLGKMGQLTPGQQERLREQCEEVLDDNWGLEPGELDRLLSLNVD